jgi:hypothetical protein
VPQPDPIGQLKRKRLITVMISLLVGSMGAGAICLYFEPGFLGVPAEQRQAFQGHWILLLLGTFLCVVCTACSVTAVRRTRRLLWIRRHVRPIGMLVDLKIEEGSDLTDYYAQLEPLGGGDAGQSSWYVSLWQVPPGIRQQRGTRFPADIYFDPATGTPAVIESEHGTLWVMAGRGSCQRLGAEEHSS